MGSSTSKTTTIALLCYLFAIIILYSSMSCGSSNVGCNARDQEALEIFKGSIKDPGKLLSSWSTEQDCCHWFGVQCDNVTRRVTELDLHCTDDNKCLGGQINLYVLKLEFLSFLDLHDNDFYAIYTPPTIHNMSMMSNFSNLVFLDFSYNHGFRMDDLRWISQLSSLKYLNLSDANLSKETLWLQSVNMLPSLLELRLSHCSLKSIQSSPEHFNSSSLELLDISGNDFYTEATKLQFNLSNSISYLDLSFNYLKGQVPEELSNFRRLKGLDLRFNNFNGSIPEWVGQYNQLEYLDISVNCFSGPIPETLVNLSSLVYLDVGYNSLNGSLPKSLGQHSELQGFFAGNNLLSGSISPFLCKAMIGNKNLKVLYLSHNHFSGKLLDCWIHGKSHLKVLHLQSNQFSGNIPSLICQLSNLQILNLADNRLTGSIPKCLSNITAMAAKNSSDFFNKNYYYTRKKLMIGYSLRTSTSIEHIHLYFKGRELEFNPYTLQYLYLIDLSKNELSGSIPRELFTLVSLISLNLSHNHLMNSIPDDIGRMENLDCLDLSWNQLAGGIPKSLANLRGLAVLNLSYNHLRGKIPLGTLLQSFEASSYMGNPELFGAPLTKDNSHAETPKSHAETPNSQIEIPNEKKRSSDNEFMTSFKMGMAIGFAYGFWGVCFALFLINPWRIAYFRFLNNMYDRIYVFVALKTKWLHQNLANSPK